MKKVPVPTATIPYRTNVFVPQYFCTCELTVFSMDSGVLPVPGTVQKQRRSLKIMF